MSYQTSVAPWTSHRNTEAPKFVVPVALSVLGAVGVLVSSEPAHAVSCGETLMSGFGVLEQNLECEESPALKVAGEGGVLDLMGHTLTCAPDENGALAGTGIEVTGSQAEIRNGKIKNCLIGVRVRGDGSNRLKYLTVTSPGMSGDQGIAFRVESDSNQFFHNIVIKYAGEAFRVHEGDYNVFKNNQAKNNANHGFRVRRGQYNRFVWNESKGNAAEGFRSQGPYNSFMHNIAKNNGDEGIRLRDGMVDQPDEGGAFNNLVIGNLVENNGLSPCNPFGEDADANPGIAVTRGAWGNTIRKNKLRHNCIGIGIDRESPPEVPPEDSYPASQNNKVIRNTVRNSRILDMVDANDDCDNNTWRKNEFRTSASGPFPSEFPFPPDFLFPECIGHGHHVRSLVGQGKDLLQDAEESLRDAAESLSD